MYTLPDVASDTASTNPHGDPDTGFDPVEDAVANL